MEIESAFTSQLRGKARSLQLYTTSLNQELNKHCFKYVYLQDYVITDYNVDLTSDKDLHSVAAGESLWIIDQNNQQPATKVLLSI